MQGIVKWFNDAKGYGFIEPDGKREGEKDFYVHFSEIKGQSGRKTLVEGDRVEFKAGTGDRGKGPVALEVHVI